MGAAFLIASDGLLPHAATGGAGAGLGGGACFAASAAEGGLEATAAAADAGFALLLFWVAPSCFLLSLPDDD